jgi:hypothetical protein
MDGNLVKLWQEEANNWQLHGLLWHMTSGIIKVNPSPVIPETIWLGRSSALCDVIFLVLREVGKLQLADGARPVNIFLIVLDVIHRPVFYLKRDISESKFCLRFQVETTQVGPIDRASRETETSSFYWDHLCRFHLKTETESSFRNVVFKIKHRTMDNGQSCYSYINIPLSQSYGSYLWPVKSRILNYHLPVKYRVQMML